MAMKIKCLHTAIIENSISNEIPVKNCHSHYTYIYVVV